MFPAELHRVEPALEPVDFDRIPGFGEDGLLQAWRSFERSWVAIKGGVAQLRPALPFPSQWLALFDRLAERARTANDHEAKRLFHEWFRPFRVRSRAGAFFTGYYEPEMEGRRRRTPHFTEPVLARPADLETFPQGHFPLGGNLAAGRRLADGSLAPFPPRKEIEEGRFEWKRPIVWVRDAVEAFKIHVQGSARVRLDDGSIVRLTYAGRNGRPYTSIGSLLVREGRIPEEDASPRTIYRYARDRGLALGEAGRALLQKNESYIFFEVNSNLDPNEGPIGGASAPLTPRRSIAIDRQYWPYGLPFWIAGDWAESSGRQFERMLIGQDTGAAIVGPARVDIFFGWGREAGRAAGDVRHGGELFAFLPRPNPSL